MMGDDERRRILQMVSEGKVSPEEAADLLDAVEDASQRTTRMSAMPTETNFNMRPPRPGRPMSARALTIVIKEGGDNKVNIRIPLALARVAGKFIPRQAQNYLQNYEIDLQQFLEDAGEIEGGTILEVKDGENRVLIAVE
jgi:hypothetical protein